MTRTLLAISVLCSFMLAACHEEVTCHFDTTLIQSGVTQGDIVRLHLYCGEDEMLPGDITVASNAAPTASVRETADRVEDDHQGFYLLAHRPGAATLTATRDGQPVATAQVTIREQ